MLDLSMIYARFKSSINKDLKHLTQMIESIILKALSLELGPINLA